MRKNYSTHFVKINLQTNKKKNVHNVYKNPGDVTLTTTTTTKNKNKNKKRFCSSIDGLSCVKLIPKIINLHQSSRGYPAILSMI